MQSIIRFSMKNAVAVFILILMLVGGGLYSMGQMKMEKYPQVDIPYLHINITYPGASPEQVMQDFGKTMEQELSNLKGVEDLYSGAGPNYFFATLKFSMSADMKQGERDARDAVSKIKLPDTARTPSFQKESIDEDVYAVAFYGASQDIVQKFVEDTLRPSLRSISGIDTINTLGLVDKKLYVRLRPEALKEQNLSYDQVRQLIQANNVSIPIGDYNTPDQKLPVRASKSLTSEDDVKNIPLIIVNPAAVSNGESPIRTIKLSDIADVSYESTAGSIYRIDGQPAVSLSIKALGGEDAVAIAKTAMKKVDEAVKPDGVQVVTLTDRSHEIEHSVNSMLREVGLGALMAVLVTLLFLRNLRSTLIAVISIPLSMFASFIVLNRLGYTLNMMSLAGIAVAIGRVVDDSIVVMENIFRRVRMSAERDMQLVELATREVSKAITSSTVTTVAVFLPLAFVPGIVGKFFVPLAWTIVISLLFSLLVAVSVVPLLSRLFLLRLRHAPYLESRLQKLYRSTLKWALRHRLVTLLLALVLLAGSGALAPGLGFNFLPTEKVNQYRVNVKMPIGTSLTKTEQIADKINQILKGRDEITQISTSIGSESAGLTFRVKDSIRDSKPLAGDLREQFKSISDAKEVTLVGMGGLPGNSQFQMVVNGPNITAIKQGADQIVGAIKNISGLSEVRSSAEGEKPEISIRFDDQKLAANGLTPATVALSLHNMVEGTSITKSQVGGKTTDVTLSLKMDQNGSLDALRMQKLTNPLGQQIALQDIGTIEKVMSPTTISHYNQADYLQINGTITASGSGAVTSEATKAVKELTLPAGVTWSMEGASKEMNQGFINVGIAWGLSVFLVYLVMLFAFGEWSTPIVILFAIPFSLIGSLVGLVLVKEPIGMPAMIGLLMLNGIVVTNAIVLLERVKTNQANGMRKVEALLEAGVTRLRPIMMTAVATVGALLPLALSTEAGLVSRSLAVVVIGGLTTSTFLTLIIVPVLYSLFTRNKRRAVRAAITTAA